MNFFSKKKKYNEEIIIQEPENISLNETYKRDHTFKYDKSWENKSFLAAIDILDVKSILYSQINQPIALKNGYAGYLQICEVYGRDVQVMSEEEQQEIIWGYTQWLSSLDFDITEQTTTLPTDTSPQVAEWMRILQTIRKDILSPDLSFRQKKQLEQRQFITTLNIVVEEVVGQSQYNTEFFVWIFGDTLQDLNKNTSLAFSASNNFQIHNISSDKKEMIIKQYYNYNEKG